MMDNYLITQVVIIISLFTVNREIKGYVLVKQ